MEPVQMLRCHLGAFRGLKLLLDEFKEAKHVTAAEFIEGKLEDENSPVDEDVARMFLNAYRVRAFLQLSKGTFLKALDEKYSTKDSLGKQADLEVMIYTILFELNETNFERILPYLDSLIPLSTKLIAFFHDDSKMTKIVEIACKFFDNDYILDNIVNPLIRNKRVIACIHSSLVWEKKRKHTLDKKPNTIPKGPSFASSPKVPAAPPPTPEMLENFIASKVPKSNKRPSRKFELKLEKAKTENHRRALELISLAQRDAFKCANLTEKPKFEPPTYNTVRAKPCPKFSDVQVKPTNATLRREAAILAKEREDEIKQLEELTNGSCDFRKYEMIEENIQKSREQERLQELERKHLQGLLTYEEAILAKKKLLKANQSRMEEFRMERSKLLQEIDELRIAESEKNKTLVEKAQAIEIAAREAEKKAADERRCNAKLIDYETKRLLQEAAKAREEEFTRKLQLIQEIRAIQHFNASTYVKDFDRTECANLGLINEMSIAELQERLCLLKLKMQEELNERRERIYQEKLQQQSDLDDMKNFILEARKGKIKETPVNVELQETGDILELREKLHKARSLRMNSDS